MSWGFRVWKWLNKELPDWVAGATIMLILAVGTVLAIMIESLGIN